MANFFFPITWLLPTFEGDVCGNDLVRIHRRKWEVPVFDLYSLLAERHPIRVPPELMQVFLQSVNLEFETAAADFPEAADRIDAYRAMLYLRGTCPTVAPFGCNTSLNAYAGINARSSGHQATMHEGIREGITHATARVETWSHELSFACIVGAPGQFVRDVGEGVANGAERDLTKWLNLEKEAPVLRAARRALVKAPLMPDLGSSILHIWQGIESLFPSISTEITFRTSLLLAELLVPLHPRSVTYETARKSYGDRSKISHGSQKPVSMEHWARSWLLLRDALQAILLHGNMPSEEDLTRSLLNDD